jgi:predicted AlkP superfamily phosphohydrolase/phosphomutase
LKSDQKVLIIGLDGGTWKIFKHMMEKMPCLKKLVEEGSSGVLKSSIPPITAAAWSSFQTGVNPGKHGIIHFQSFDPITKQIRFVNSNDINVKTIWELVSEQNKKVIAINVPVTYPPKEVNGIIIGGMLSPKVDERFVYPKEIFERYIKGCGYKIVAGRLERRASMTLKDFIGEQIRVEEKRFDLARKLMKEYEWHLFMVHNQLLDPLQHSFYPYLDPESSGYDEEKFEEISKFYEASDRLISELIEAAGKDTTVILLSDHGAAEVSCYVNLNAWLLKNGYLKLTYKRLLGNIITSVRKLDVHDIAKKILGKLVKSPTFIMRVSGRASQNLINFKKTQAFSINGIIWGNMHINEIKSAHQIIEKLKHWKDPSTNKNIIKRIYRKEEIFSGPCLDSLPDIFLEPNEGYAFHTPLIKNMKMYHRVIVTRYERVGTHDLNGILVIKGDNIEKHKEIEANIIDVAPTVLAILGFPIPKHMDGQVLKGVFIEKPEIKFGEAGLSERIKLKEHSEEDEKEIEKRLKDLGYL